MECLSLLVECLAVDIVFDVHVLLDNLTLVLQQLVVLLVGRVAIYIF